MARIARLEREGESLKQIQGRTIAVLADLSQRIDRLGDVCDELNQRVDGLRDSLEGRLDRLIAVTMQERTYSIERFADLERRVARLEARED